MTSGEKYARYKLWYLSIIFIVGAFHPKLSLPVFSKMKDSSYEDSFLEPDVDPENPEYKVRTGNHSKVYQSSDKQNKINSGGLSSRDLQPGDQELTSPDSSPARLGVYRGNVIRAKASNLAQILLSAFKDLVRIISRNFQLYSDAGKLELLNVADETKLELRIGSSFKEETHPSKELWRVRHRVGGASNSLETIVSDPTADGKEGSWDGVTDLYKATVAQNGALAVSTKETISATAVKDISIDSTTANVKTTAAMNIENTATMSIIDKAQIEHSIETISIKTAAVNTQHTSNATYTITSPTFTRAGLTNTLQGITFCAGPLVVSGPALFGGALTPTASGSTPDHTVKSTAFFQAFNSHTHATAMGSSGPPRTPLIAASDLTTDTLIG
jgi:hypothetical protein